MENAEEEETVPDDQQTVASSYMCMKPLVSFCEKMMQGNYGLAFCKPTNDLIAGKSSKQEDYVKNILVDISTKYAAGFPLKLWKLGHP